MKKKLIFRLIAGLLPIYILISCSENPQPELPEIDISDPVIQSNQDKINIINEEINTLNNEIEQLKNSIASNTYTNFQQRQNFYQQAEALFGEIAVDYGNIISQLPSNLQTNPQVKAINERSESLLEQIFQTLSKVQSGNSNQIEQAQTLLQEKGYYLIQIDGYDGPKLANATQQYLQFSLGSINDNLKELEQIILNTTPPDTSVEPIVIEESSPESDSSWSWLSSWLMGLMLGTLLTSAAFIALLFDHKNKRKKQIRSGKMPTSSHFQQVLNDIHRQLSVLKTSMEKLSQNSLTQSVYQEQQQLLANSLANNFTQLQQYLTYTYVDKDTYNRDLHKMETMLNTLPQSFKLIPLDESFLNEYLKIYHNQPELFLQYVEDYHEVRESEKQQQLRQRKNTNTVILEEDNTKGDFWVVEFPESNLSYLFLGDYQPSSSQAFTIKALFDGYVESDEGNLVLIKPGLVKQIDRRRWVLQKKGLLKIVK